MRSLTLLSFLLLAAHAAADPALAVSSDAAADGKTLVSARSGAWGAPPLGPGTVTFTAATGAVASGDVHLGLAQAVLSLPCGVATRVTAEYVPTAGGGRASGETTVVRPC